MPVPVDTHARQQFAEIGGINAQVRGNVFLRQLIEQVRAPLGKCFEVRFHVKGHQLKVPLNHACQHVLCGFAKEGLDGVV